MKTIKIALSLALGMTAACYVGPGDELIQSDEDRTDKLTFASGRDADVDKNDSSCDDHREANVGEGLAAPVDSQSQGNPPPPPPPPPGPGQPNIATEQELINACEELEGIEMTCEELCESFGLEFTGEIRIDPGSVTHIVTQSQDNGMMCPNGMPDITTTTTTTGACACCCAAPPTAG